MGDITIFSLNVRGLRNRTKRKKVFRMLKQNNFDIICLQETYITCDVADQWKLEWGGELIYSEGTPHSKGQIVLIKKSFPHSWTTEIIKERILALKVNVGSNDLVIFNVYAPSCFSDTRSFYDDLTDFVNSCNCNQKVVCGDFNAVLNNSLDIISGENHSLPLVQLFNDFVNSCCLNDAWRVTNPNTKEYTWSRKSNNKFTARRLDYVFLDDGAMDIETETRICSVPSSDHRGIFVSLNYIDVQRGPGYWKFNNSLLKDKVFVDKMNDTIEQFITSNSTEKADYLWELLKLKIKEESVKYSKHAAIKRKNNSVDLSNKIALCELALAQTPNDLTLQNKCANLKLQLDLHEQIALKSAQVRSRVKWIEEGERNTKYFLNLEKSRANGKLFSSLELDSGDIVVNQSDILKCQKSYFETLYGRNIYDKNTHENLNVFLEGIKTPELSEDEIKICEGIILVDEASTALKMMKNGSAPGLDGLTTEFIKFFWVKLKHVIVQSFNSSFEQGKLSHTQREAVLTLIHKGKDLPKNRLEHWRPISLTNTDYKILAKCLANRLCTVINTIVNEDQVGYIKGRNVSNNLRTIDDVLEYLRFKEKPGILLALDFQKAFDSISKNYMIHAFKRFGFGTDFVQWIQVLFSDIRSCIGYNGWLSSDFEVKCGIRQGCPFSPLAFIVSIELLAIRLRQCSEIKSLSVAKDKVLKILLYADDLTMFIQDKDDIKMVLKILSQFTSVSGLQLNMQKSEAMLIGSKRNERNESYSEFGLKWVNMIKILGIYFSSSKCASDVDMNWQSKILIIKRIISGWEKRNLGILGKICVIKSFLLSQLIYLLQAICLPEKVLRMINTILYRFLWRKKIVIKRHLKRLSEL